MISWGEIFLGILIGLLGYPYAKRIILYVKAMMVGAIK